MEMMRSFGVHGTHVLGAALAVGLMACGDRAAAPSDTSAKPSGPASAEAPSSAGEAEAPAKPSGPVGTLDPSTLPGAIVFISERDGNLEVYRWRAGAKLSRLTDDPRADFVGEVAADGSGWTRVATEDGATPEEHREQLMWMPTEGEPVLIGEPGRRGRSPSWSPDRSFVVFESDVGAEFSDLWRWAPGQAPKRLTTTEHGAFEPAVSPDGAKVAFVSTEHGNPELHLMKADGSEPQRLTEWRRDDMSPRWSPDGTRLAFLRRERGGERLFVLHLPSAGAELREQRLVPTAEGEKVKHADHAWSPDGRALVYSVDRPKASPQVVVSEVEGGATRVVSPPHLRATMPSLSPDGRFVVFAGTEDDPAALDIYVVASEGGAWARLTTHAAPDWLPRWTS